MNSFDNHFMNAQRQRWNMNLNTNVYLVTSLEEALMRTNTCPSDMVYFHQDLDIMYRVKVDEAGRKTWGQYNISMNDPNNNIAVTRGDLKELNDRILKLENMVIPKEGRNGEFNEQRSIYDGGEFAT